MFDTVIIGGTVVTPQATKPSNIGLLGGRIAAVADPGDHMPAITTVDATGKFILPGLVDAHVHIPGWLLSKSMENFETATQAAAAGGVTTVLLMPTDDPRVISPSYFSMKVKAGAQSYVDFGIQALASPWMDELIALAEMGPVSFEVFLSYGGSPRFIVGTDDFELLRLVRMIKEVNGVLGVTPHSPTLNNRLTLEHKEEPFADVRTIAMTRPVLSEVLGITRACSVARDVGARCHIRSVSSRSGLDVIRMHREYIDLSSEVMFHHLIFDSAEARRMGPYGVITPPIREREDQDCLIEAVGNGEIDMVVSDHSPALKRDKENGWGNIWDTPPGMTGLQTMIYAMISLVEKERLAITDIARLCCEAPARKFNLFPRKGRIQEGSDADLVILNPNKGIRIANEDQLSRAKYTTLHGHTTRMSVERVMLRGNWIFDEGRPVGDARGQIIRPPTLPTKNGVLPL